MTTLVCEPVAETTETRTLDVTTEVRSIGQWNQIAPIWSDLAQASPDCSFFLTPDWVRSWLEVFGQRLRCEFLVFKSGDEPVGATLLVYRTQRVGPFWVRRVYLNTAGENQADTVYIEHNNLLCRPGWETGIARALASHLANRKWDDLAANGCSAGRSLEVLKSAFPDLRESGFVESDYYVDLDVVRSSPEKYERLLAQKVRLRQSLKRYGEIGELRLESAATPERALQMLDELAELHVRSWVARGRPGVFSSRQFMEFHRNLIRRALPKGAVQLLRVTAGDRAVGILYNFIQRGTVYFYQSGLSYGNENQLRPGHVAHYLAICHCAEQGLREYDFLAGEDRYKKYLSTNSRQMAWVALRRPRWKFGAIDFLRQVKRDLPNKLRLRTTEAS